MAPQQPGQRLSCLIPDGYQRIRAATGQLCAIGTPCQIREGHRIALDEMEALAAFSIPHPQGAIFTATEQTVVTWQEGDRLHCCGMTMQGGAIAPLFTIPHLDGFVVTATREQGPISAPGDPVHRTCVSCQRLAHLSTSDIPQLDGSIKTSTGQRLSIRSKGH